MTKSLKQSASVNRTTKLSANKVNGQNLAKSLGHEDSNFTHVYLRKKQNHSAKSKGQK